MTNSNNSSRLKKALPWIFCALVFFLLFKQIHPHEVWEALKLASLPKLFIYGLGYFVIVLFVDLIALKHFINRFATTVSFQEMFLVRGVTYLMMILNYAASQGILAVYLRKTHKASVAKTLGTLFFITLADVLLILMSALIALAFSSVTFHGLDLRSLALKSIPAIYLGAILWALFWKHTEHPVILRLRRFKIVDLLLSHNLFLIFREATLIDYGLLFLLRAPLLVIVIAGYNFGVMAFNSHIDWTWVFLYNPITMFITALPLTPAGLGTGQFLTIAFFKDVIQSPLFAAGLSTPENILFASSLSWNLVNQIFKALFGSFCLMKSQRHIFDQN